MTNTRRKSASKAPALRGASPDAALHVAAPIEILNKQRLHRLDQHGLRRLARAVLDAIGKPAATLTISFIRDAQMRTLNRTYRGFDKPTDVLSFAYHEGNDEDEFVLAENTDHLGDVVISVETAERYAAELGLTLARELEYLVIHGVLHLAGYDHETDQGEMLRLEKRLRRRLLLS